MQPFAAAYTCAYWHSPLASRILNPKSENKLLQIYSWWPMADCLLTIAICTHNRADDVEQCISTLSRQTASRVPILVVDSGSDARNSQKLAELSIRHDFELIVVEEPGLSAARNAALANCKSRWIAFLDDDTLPAHDWADSALNAVATASSNTAVIGGRILPRWPGRTPTHVGRRYLMFLSCVDAAAGTTSVPCYGANMLCRRDVALDAGGFCEEMGRKGANLLSGEEALLIATIRDAGWQTVYDARVLVEHKIPQARLTLEWIRERAFWGGVTEVFLERKRGRRIPSNLNPLKLSVSIPVLTTLSWLHDPDLDRYIRAWYARGALAGLRHPCRPASIYENAVSRRSLWTWAQRTLRFNPSESFVQAIGGHSADMCADDDER